MLFDRFWINVYHEIQNMKMFNQQLIQVFIDIAFEINFFFKFFLGDSLTKFLKRNEEIRACKLIQMFYDYTRGDQSIRTDG
jgi:hypothetical protein